MIKDRDILEAAILGYQAQISRIEGKIAGIKAQLGSPAPSIAPAKGGGSSLPGPFKKPRKKLSAKARKAIGAATKKRWAEGKMKQGKG